MVSGLNSIGVTSCTRKQQSHIDQSYTTVCREQKFWQLHQQQCLNGDFLNSLQIRYDVLKHLIQIIISNKFLGPVQKHGLSVVFSTYKHQCLFVVPI